MSKAFDMELFLAGALTGSHTTRHRHRRQAQAIQAVIADRWQRDNPWTWQQKHLTWFLNHHVNQHAKSMRYYYQLTVHLITVRLEKSWQLKISRKSQIASPRLIERPKVRESSNTIYGARK